MGHKLSTVQLLITGNQYGRLWELYDILVRTSGIRCLLTNVLSLSKRDNEYLGTELGNICDTVGRAYLTTACSPSPPSRLRSSHLA